LNKLFHESIPRTNQEFTIPGLAEELKDTNIDSNLLYNSRVGDVFKKWTVINLEKCLKSVANTLAHVLQVTSSEEMQLQGYLIKCLLTSEEWSYQTIINLPLSARFITFEPHKGGSLDLLTDLHGYTICMRKQLPTTCNL
jgi:hypothetical protein